MRTVSQNLTTRAQARHEDTQEHRNACAHRHTHADTHMHTHADTHPQLDGRTDRQRQTETDTRLCFAHESLSRTLVQTARASLGAHFSFCWGGE